MEEGGRESFGVGTRGWEMGEIGRVCEGGGLEGVRDGENQEGKWETLVCFNVQSYW